MTEADLTPLRPLLYQSDGALFGMRRREVPELVGPVIRRKSRYSQFRYEYVRTSDVTLYLQQHGIRDDLQLLL